MLTYTSIETSRNQPAHRSSDVLIDLEFKDLFNKDKRQALRVGTYHFFVIISLLYGMFLSLMYGIFLMSHF
jgi:hypothetical protein